MDNTYSLSEKELANQFTNVSDIKEHKINEYNDIQQQQVLDQIKSQTNQTIQTYQQMMEKVYQYKSNVQRILDQMVSTLTEEISTMNELNNQLRLDLNIEDYKRQMNVKHLETQTLIVEQFKKLQYAIQIDRFQTLFQQLVQKFISEKEIQIYSLHMLNNQPFEYKLHKKSGKSQIEVCYAIAFNQESSLIFYGCNQFIKVSEFKNGCISSEIQKMSAHTDKITCLQYLKCSNELISAGIDNLIIIWSKNNQGLWTIKQKLNEHKNCVDALTLNLKEDLLVSGSQDSRIKFWGKKNQVWKLQQTIQIQFWASGLSFDDQHNRLIACGFGKPEILVITQKQNQEWFIAQTIKVKNYGIRLCFINSNMFVFQPNEAEKLEIYELSIKENQFKIKKDLQVKSSAGNYAWFPCQFISSKGIAIVKNNSYLNIIRRLENGEFLIQQSLNFPNNTYFGRVTDDGEYMAIWTEKSAEIQIRKLEYLK